VFVLFGMRNIFARMLVVIVVAGAFARSIALTSDALHIETSEDLVKGVDYFAHTAAQGSSIQGGSSQPVPRFQDAWGMVKFAPVGALTALFRPLPGEVLNPFGLLASVENLAVLALLLRAIRRTTWGEVRQPLILWAISVILLWSVAYGFVSAQNLGAAARWKLQILPLLVGLLCYLGRRRRREATDAAGQAPHPLMGSYA
jgi:hypothetical protein